MHRFLGKVIVVQHLPPELQTQSGLLIPENVHQTSGPCQAVVHFVGKKSAHREELNPRDTVIVPRQLGNRLKLDGELYVIYDDCDVLALVNTREQI